MARTGRGAVGLGHLDLGGVERVDVRAPPAQRPAEDLHPDGQSTGPDGVSHGIIGIATEAAMSGRDTALRHLHPDDGVDREEERREQHHVLCAQRNCKPSAAGSSCRPSAARRRFANPRRATVSWRRPLCCYERCCYERCCHERCCYMTPHANRRRCPHLHPALSDRDPDGVEDQPERRHELDRAERPARSMARHTYQAGETAQKYNRRS